MRKYVLLLALLALPFSLLAQGPSVVTPTASSGSNGVGSGASPIMGYYLGNNCPTTNAGKCFFTPNNTQIDINCTWSNASTTVTCSDNPFVAGDVGKQVGGWSTCQADNASNQYASSNADTTPLTIVTYTDSGHVV